MASNIRHAREIVKDFLGGGGAGLGEGSPPQGGGAKCADGGGNVGCAEYGLTGDKNRGARLHDGAGSGIVDPAVHLESDTRVEAPRKGCGPPDSFARGVKSAGQYLWRQKVGLRLSPQDPSQDSSCILRFRIPG